jgi:Fe-S-cluster-containing dehydrogenase component/DMSO reductase anchor subunit
MSANYFIFDKNKCVGCQACVVACMNENGFQANQQWRNIYTQNEAKVPGIPLFHISLACNHCEKASCMKYCPALAYKRSLFSGAILHLSEHCIGCQYCVWNCPYEAPKFNPFEGVVEKCNFCESRQQEGLAPACATLCPTGALDFSNAEIDKTSITPGIKVATNLSPSLLIKELDNKNGPEMDLSLFDEEDKILREKKTNHISALHEWPLLIFTFIISVLVALSVAGTSEKSVEWLKWSMTMGGALGALLSSFHLGKKIRMWRAILNLRHSWLSREIFFFGLYYTLMILNLWFINLNYYVVLIPGILLLFSIDMLYQPVQQKWKIPFHSGQSIFIALSLTLLLLQYYLILLAFMMIRMGVSLFSFHLLYEKLFKNTLFMIRWGLIDISIILVIFDASFFIILLMILLGEFLDRVIFYNQLLIQKITIE